MTDPFERPEYRCVAKRNKPGHPEVLCHHLSRNHENEVGACTICLCEGYVNPEVIEKATVEKITVKKVDLVRDESGGEVCSTCDILKMHEISKEESEPGKVVQKWSDPAMFTAEPTPTDGPKVHLLSMTPDPLGTIAAVCSMYKGNVIRSVDDVTDGDRIDFFEQVQKTHLKAPFEFVQFHFLIEGVTRGFTHQLVRQRTATYAQRSDRFAVQEGELPVGLPPSLRGTKPWDENDFELQAIKAVDSSGVHFVTDTDRDDAIEEWIDRNVSKADRQRRDWDDAMARVSSVYKDLVLHGMSQEDARGILPTNLLTAVHYRTDLRSLIEHGGNRLCTQAQFEWRAVFAAIVAAIREYGYATSMPSLEWQTGKIADVFRPICYLTGKCEFKANFDRACSIRDRVDAFAEHGVPSSDWHKQPADRDNGLSDGLHSIAPVEWLGDPGAAR